MTVYSRPWHDLRLREGDKYIISRRPTDVANGSSSAIVIENTSGTTPIFVESLIFKNNQGKAYVDATKNISIDANGTSVSVEDMRVDGTNEISGISAEFGGTYTGGSTFNLDMAIGSAGGGEATARSSTATESSAFLIAPGEAMRFKLQNQSSSTTDQLLKAVVVQPDV